MSILIVTLPSPPRLAAQAQAVSPQAGEWAFLYSEDGRQLTRHGHAAPGQWPPVGPQTEIVALVAPGDVVWHRAAMPKASGPKLRAALYGVLEDDLLDDSAGLHLAVQPEAKAGESVWVAALSRPWLVNQLAAMAACGCPADRIVPLWAPDERPAGHLYRPPVTADESPAAPWLAWRDAQGPVTLPMDSDGARALVAQVPPDMPVRWTADPDCADAAGHWVTQLPNLSAGATVAAVSAGQQMLTAAAQPWNLRQFDLAARPRRGGPLGPLWQQFSQAPAWRAVRWGLVAWAVVQLAGLNLYALRLAQQEKNLRAAQVQLLQTTFPQVRAIQDAPLQMQKEVDLLRAAAGRPGPADIETLLGAAQRAWPPGRPAAATLAFVPGQLTLSPPWQPAEVSAAQARLRPLGVDIQAAAAGVALTPWRPTPGAAAPAPSAGPVATPQAMSPAMPPAATARPPMVQPPGTHPASPAALQPLQPQPSPPSPPYSPHGIETQ